MDELLYRAVGLALVGALLALLFKKESPELSYATTLAVAVALAAALLAGFSTLRRQAAALLRAGQIEEKLAGALLKITLTAILSKGAAELCRDAGQSAAAYFVELAGTLAALALALPAFRGLIEAIGKMFTS